MALNPTVPPAQPAAPVVEPKPGVTAAPAAEPAPEQAAGSLPEELVQIPAIQGLLAGAPAAVSASIADFSNRPEGQLIAANKEPLMAAGMGLYRSIAGDLGVLFNRMYVSDEEIANADKQGTLAEIAPAFDEVNQSISASGDKHPALNPELKPPNGVQDGGSAGSRGCGAIAGRWNSSYACAGSRGSSECQGQERAARQPYERS